MQDYRVLGYFWGPVRWETMPAIRLLRSMQGHVRTCEIFCSSIPHLPSSAHHFNRVVFTAHDLVHVADLMLDIDALWALRDICMEMGYHVQPPTGKRRPVVRIVPPPPSDVAPETRREMEKPTCLMVEGLPRLLDFLCVSTRRGLPEHYYSRYHPLEEGRTASPPPFELELDLGAGISLSPSSHASDDLHAMAACVAKLASLADQGIVVRTRSVFINPTDLFCPDYGDSGRTFALLLQRFSETLVDPTGPTRVTVVSTRVDGVLIPQVGVSGTLIPPPTVEDYERAFARSGHQAFVDALAVAFPRLDVLYFRSIADGFAAGVSFLRIPPSVRVLLVRVLVNYVCVMERVAARLRPASFADRLASRGAKGLKRVSIRLETLTPLIPPKFGISACFSRWDEDTDGDPAEARRAPPPFATRSVTLSEEERGGDPPRDAPPAPAPVSAPL